MMTASKSWVPGSNGEAEGLPSGLVVQTGEEHGEATDPAPRGKQSGRWRASPVARAGMPWFMSLVVHGVLLACAAVMLWRLSGREPPVPPRPPVVSISDPAIGENPKEVNREKATRAASSEVIGAGMESGRTDASNESNVKRSVGAMPFMAQAPGAYLSGSVAKGRTSSEPLDLGVKSGGHTGAGGRAADEGVTRDHKKSDAGATVTFAGLGSSGARSVVYVVDASGPMVSSLRDVIAEIERSVGRLVPSQKFGVVVFHHVTRGSEADAPEGGESKKFELFMPVLVRATPEARERLSAWLARIEPKGRSNPLDGLTAGLALAPEAVFLLSRSIERTDGGVWEFGLEATMKELDRLNPLDPTRTYRSVAIKTIQFLGDDPTGIMQAIGQQHGGGGSGGGGDPGYKVVRQGRDLE